MGYVPGMNVDSYNFAKLVYQSPMYAGYNTSYFGNVVDDINIPHSGITNMSTGQQMEIIINEFYEANQAGLEHIDFYERFPEYKNKMWGNAGGLTLEDSHRRRPYSVNVGNTTLEILRLDIGKRSNRNQLWIDTSWSGRRVDSKSPDKPEGGLL